MNKKNKIHLLKMHEILKKNWGAKFNTVFPDWVNIPEHPDSLQEMFVGMFEELPTQHKTEFERYYKVEKAKLEKRSRQAQIKKELINALKEMEE